MGASVLLLAAGVQAATTFVTVEVTSASGVQWDPAIRDERVAYTDLSGEDGDIWVYDLRNGSSVRVVDDAASQTLEDIGSTHVVYTDDRNRAVTGLDIFAYELATGLESAVVVGAGNQTEPAVSGPRVVWEHAEGSNVDVYAGTVDGATPLALTSHPAVQWRPAVSGDVVVWEDARNGNPDIFAYWFSTPPAPFSAGENAVAIGSALARRPDVDGTRVVWDQQASGGAQSDIWMFDFATNTLTQITNDAANQMRPRISGNLIVWEDHRNAATSGIDLYGWDLATNSEVAFVAGPETEFLHDVDARTDGGFDIAYTIDRGSGNMDILVLRATIEPDPTPTPTRPPEPTETPAPTPTPPPVSGDPCDPASGAPEYFAETFERGHGQPEWEDREFAAPSGPATVCLTLEHVSAAWVELNNADVFGPSDFNPNVSSARASVTLEELNELSVKLAGKPCGDESCEDGDDDDGDDDGDDDCEDDDDDDCRYKPHSGHYGHRHARRSGDDHDDDDDDDDGDDDDGDDDDGDHDGDDGDDDGASDECARMTVRVVGPAPAAPSAIGTFDPPEPEPDAPIAVNADPAPYGGCSVAPARGAAGASPLAALFLLGTVLLAARRRRK